MRIFTRILRGGGRSFRRRRRRRRHRRRLGRRNCDIRHQTMMVSTSRSSSSCTVAATTVLLYRQQRRRTGGKLGPIITGSGTSAVVVAVIVEGIAESIHHDVIAAPRRTGTGIVVKQSGGAEGKSVCVEFITLLSSSSSSCCCCSTNVGIPSTSRCHCTVPVRTSTDRTGIDGTAPPFRRRRHLLQGSRRRLNPANLLPHGGSVIHNGAGGACHALVQDRGAAAGISCRVANSNSISIGTAIIGCSLARTAR
mmetsp:Transcript_21637/g.48348  ORF Transcript_21637/g.48348 Transcript_21637/m.48348 type:complete len:252 (-) Transcript_21637:780-1535(-)